MVKPALLILILVFSLPLLLGCVQRAPASGLSYNNWGSTNSMRNSGYPPGNGSSGLRRSSFEPRQFQTWVDSDPIYRLLPGDQLNIFVYSAPELNQTLIIGPDGRVVMPLARPIMAANLTIEQLEQRLSHALSSQLIDPKLDLSPLSYGSQQIFVGGEVKQPGVYELPGQIGTLEAVFIAGGFTNTAKTKHVVLVRRHPNGAPMMKVINLKSLLNNRTSNDMTPLRRGDVIYVPRSTIGDINLFMQQYIRDALPVNFSLTYNLVPYQ